MRLGNRLVPSGPDRLARNRAGGTGLIMVVLVLAVTVISSVPVPGAQGAGSAIDGVLHYSPCTRRLLGGRVSLDITPKPVKAMHDLTFTVTLSGLTPTADPFIDLGMPGMVMGPNRVPLRPAGDGTYQGTGVIVRCPSGRRAWKATVTVPGKGAVEFIFDVVY